MEKTYPVFYITGFMNQLRELAGDTAALELDKSIQLLLSKKPRIGKPVYGTNCLRTIPLSEIAWMGGGTVYYEFDGEAVYLQSAFRAGAT